MKATGIIRRIDDLGRVTIPKEIRRTLKIRENDPLELFVGENDTVCFRKYEPVGTKNYSVVCDWIFDCESGVSVLCVTPDIAEARRCLQENIKIEKTNSWIGDVDDADIGNTDECRYCEELDEDCWSFYKNGSYLEAHTTIKIFEYKKES